MKKPINVTITGAAGQIGYALAFRVASGAMLGPDQPVRVGAIGPDSHDRCVHFAGRSGVQQGLQQGARAGDQDDQAHRHGPDPTEPLSPQDAERRRRTNQVTIAASTEPNTSIGTPMTSASSRRGPSPTSRRLPRPPRLAEAQAR